jgi:hypothetical protein
LTAAALLGAAGTLLLARVEQAAGLWSDLKTPPPAAMDHPDTTDGAPLASTASRPAAPAGAVVALADAGIDRGKS